MSRARLFRFTKIVPFLLKTLLFVPTQIQRICKTHCQIVQTRNREKDNREREREKDWERECELECKQMCVSQSVRWKTGNRSTKSYIRGTWYYYRKDYTAIDKRNFEWYKEQRTFLMTERVDWKYTETVFRRTCDMSGHI